MLLMKKSQLFGRNDEKGAILLMFRANRDRFGAPPAAKNGHPCVRISRAFRPATIYSQL
jgi:hypothetical protein